MKDFKPDTAILQLLTAEQAWHYKAIPLRTRDNHLEIGIDKAVNSVSNLQELQLILDQSIKVISTESEQISRLLTEHYRKKRDRKNTSSLKVSSTDENFIFKLIEDCLEMDVSDIHIEPSYEKARVRIRIDGHMIEKYEIEKSRYPALVNKVKILAKLDIAEKRLPQDGRIFINENGSSLDIRVSSLPVLHGEKIVMRLLNKEGMDIDINKLGFASDQLSIYHEKLQKQNGIILISGPTGSGKTTTLYATLKVLNKQDRNILTIEDPIEYTLDGVNQVQLKEGIGLDYPSAMRTFLRQDPDIIMLGEIRDPETAKMAIRAALTGHLVLSTIHTNSAWGTVGRLVDMGIPPYLLASTLNMSVAQRLVRILCPHCKEEAPFDDSYLPFDTTIPFPISKHYVAKGCPECFYTGYKGRKAIYEIIPVDHQVGKAIKENQFTIDNLLQERKVEDIRIKAFKMVLTGDSSFEEIYPLMVK